MEQTIHMFLFDDSRNLEFPSDQSVGLVVTSPPYPMIQVWDEPFAHLNPEIEKALSSGDGRTAFELMHRELDKVWEQVYRVLVPGGIACINIGDAARTVDGRFLLYPNHARILSSMFALGFDTLPAVLWRKQTNAPNKFMGSGMLPPGAYVTLEHEHILVLRKGGPRRFATEDEKENRRESALFWEERNVWFSDLWDLKGTRQDMGSADTRSRNTRSGNTRSRSCAFPFELAFRLVNMFSVRGDTVFDPFLGTGTTALAAAASGRNSVGVEIDPGFRTHIENRFANSISDLNRYLEQRLKNHLRFMDKEEASGRLQYTNVHYGFRVKTSQEVRLKPGYLQQCEKTCSNPLTYRASYRETPPAA